MPTLLQSLKVATSKRKPRSKLRRIVAASVIAAVAILACVVGKQNVPIGDVILPIVNAVLK